MAFRTRGGRRQLLTALSALALLMTMLVVAGPATGATSTYGEDLDASNRLLSTRALFSCAGGVTVDGVANGDFETGDLTGWCVQEKGSGFWSAYAGAAAPFTFLPILAPPGGTYAATTDQFGPGHHIMYQDVSLSAGYMHELNFTMYLENWAGAYFFRPNFGFGGANPNQQFRIDIMDPAAPVDSLDPADVWAMVFRTELGSPTSVGYTPVAYDLSPWVGQTVRIRFAQVDNQSNFNASVDDVFIASTPLCNGLLPTIFGTPGDDIIIGTVGDDVIYADAGNDFVQARAGNDVVCGGPGDDDLRGNAGTDTMFGGEGMDYLNGGDHNDLLYGGAGADDLRGNIGDDMLWGEGGDDFLHGNAGTDDLDGGDGSDTCKAGETLTSCEA